MNRYLYNYSLFTKYCKKETGTIKASSQSKAVKCLKLKYPGHTKLKIKSATKADWVVDYKTISNYMI